MWDTKRLHKLFETGVVPIMDYGSGVWGFSKYSSLDVVQNRAIRYFMGVHNFAPFRFRRFLSMIRLGNHLITLDADRLPKKVFLWDYNIQNKNWSSDVEQLFDWLRLENIFEESKFCDLDVARDRIQEFFQSEWESEVHSKPKLREYITFKETFHTESYLKVFLPKHKRSLIAQFRCGILPLHIETGRFKNITDPDTGKIRKLKAEERIRPVCKSGDIENEIHFLLL